MVRILTHGINAAIHARAPHDAKGNSDLVATAWQRQARAANSRPLPQSTII